MTRFYILGIIAAAAIAWIAALVHRSGLSTVGLVSVGVGVALGATLAALAATLRLAGPRSLVWAVVFLALATVIFQHAWLYADFRREWREAREISPQVALFRDESPWSPWKYILHEATPGRLGLWFVDGTLIAASACGTLWATRKRVHEIPGP
jgi:hypothetical protein